MGSNINGSLKKTAIFSRLQSLSLTQGGNDILRDFSPPGIDTQVPPNLIPKIENEVEIQSSRQLTKTPSRTIKRRASIESISIDPVLYMKDWIY